MTNPPCRNHQTILFALIFGLLLTAVPLLLLSGSPAQAQSSDLQLTKADADDPVRAGELLTYTLTVTNTGATTATNVIVTDTLPVEVDFVAAESSQGDCAAPVGRVLTCTLVGDGTPSILLVSSESDVTSYYTEALTALGHDYTVFDASSGGGPTATLMSDYDLVIWAGGNSGSPSEGYGDETELAAYLDGGGRLFISAQDYHYYEGLTTFMQDDLGVSSVSDDDHVTDPITGVNDFAGLGPFTTNFPTDVTDYSDDITPNSSGRAAFVDDADHIIGVNTDTTVFFAFPWEAIANQSAAVGQAVMQAVIDYLTRGLALAFPPDQSATITVTTRVDAAASGTITNTAGVTSTELAPAGAFEPTTIQAAADLRLRKRGPATLIPDEPLTYTLTYSNAGSLTATGVVITDVIPAGLTDLNVSSSGATVTPIGSTDFVWQVADLAPGDGGVITVTARADPGLTPGTAVENVAEIAGETPEGNRGNNRSTLTSAVASCFTRVFDGVSDGPIHPTVQAAVDAANPGQLVKVAGTCDDVNQRGGHPQIAHITKSLTIQGGYTLVDWATPDPVANPTILDAQGVGRAVYITGTVDVTLDRLRLVNGQAADLGGGLLYGSDAGGGIYNPVADLTLRRTQVLSSGVSSAIPDPDEARGGGIYNGSGRLRFIDSQLAYNRLDVSAATYGGGLYNESGAVTLTRTTVRGNAALGGTEGSAGYGGGVYNESGVINLTHSSVEQNTANLAGGGLYNAGEGNGTLTLEGGVVADNQAAQAGGIYFENHLSVNDSTIDHNQAVLGGGISIGTTLFEGSDTVEGLNAMTVTNSTISRNSAVHAGGGLAMYCGSSCTATATIANSTLSGNGAGNDGGGIYQYADEYGYGDPGQVMTVLTHTTVVSNSAENGGGIYNEDDNSGTATVRYTSTILAGNGTPSGADCHNVNGTLTSGDYNLLGSTCPAGGGNDLAFGGSLDSVLAPLALNPPGETETHALVAGSPAADRIPSGANGCGEAITVDQRGVARPQGEVCDIGAYEARYALGLSKQAAPKTLQPGQPVTFTLAVTGSDVTDSDVVISDTVPDGLTYVPGSISGGDARDDSAAPQLEWTLNTLPPRTPVSVTFAATVSETLSVDQVITNTAQVTSTGTTGTPAEAEAAVTVTVPRVRFDRTDYTAGEADGTATITVTLDAANPYADVTVPFTTADGSATAGSDYVDGDADLTIPAGQPWTTTPVAITDDSVDEGSETIQLALGTPTGAASASPSAATLTILDDDGFSALYLPLVLRNTAFLPDLVVRDLRVTESDITVVIANEGTATASAPFWVDAYLDPDPAPEAVNDTWQLLCEEGIAWGVTDPLAPGEVLTLTSYDQYHVYDESNFSGVVPAGTVLYAQADAANVNDPIGGVLETHEQLGEPYNNLFGPITATTTVTASTSTVTEQNFGATGALPSRP